MRRIYFGNPGTGSDDQDDPIFGLGYEEIDQRGRPVPGTFVDITRFDPAQQICLPLGPGNSPTTETWQLVNLTGELHNFHIHQTKFHVISAKAPSGTVLASDSSVGDGIEEDTIPLPFAQPAAPYQFPQSGSCSVDSVRSGQCHVTPITVKIPFSRLGTFVYHCHILEHEDGGMMHATAAGARQTRLVAAAVLLMFGTAPGEAAAPPSTADLQAAFEAAASDSPQTHIKGLQILGAQCDMSSAGRYSCQVGFHLAGESDDRVYLDAIVVAPGPEGAWKLLNGLCR
eukprot:gene32583-37594_t